MSSYFPSHCLVLEIIVSIRILVDQLFHIYLSTTFQSATATSIKQLNTY
jgi:hypothetical protein